MGVYLTGMCLIDLYLMGRASHRRICISCVCTSRACISFTSLPCPQDTGGGNPYIDTKGVLELLIVGDSAVRLLVTLGASSAW
jgi:hypothetical protein